MKKFKVTWTNARGHLQTLIFNLRYFAERCARRHQTHVDLV